MASSRDTSNGPDLTDITETMLAFQGINQVRLELRMGAYLKKNLPVLGFELAAWQDLPDGTGATVLASAKSQVGFSDRRSVSAVIFQLMYALDAELAAEEFRKTEQK